MEYFAGLMLILHREESRLKIYISGIRLITFEALFLITKLNVVNVFDEAYLKKMQKLLFVVNFQCLVHSDLFSYFLGVLQI